MTLIRIAIFSSLIFSYSNLQAAEEDWINIVSSPQSVFSIKVGSLRIANNDSGQKVVAAVGRVTNKTSSKIEPAQWYVTLDHCKMQRGNLVITDVVGNFLSETQFVFKLGTVGSEIAEFLCSAVTDRPSNSNKNNT